MAKKEFSDDFKLRLNNRYTELVEKAFEPFKGSKLFFRYWGDVAPNKRIIMQQLADEFKVELNKTYTLIKNNHAYSQMKSDVYEKRAVVFKSELAMGNSYEVIGKRYGLGADVVRRACDSKEHTVKKKAGYSFMKTLDNMNSFVPEWRMPDDSNAGDNKPALKGNSDYVKLKLSKMRKR